MGPWRLVLLQGAAHAGLIFMCLYATPREWVISVIAYFFTGCVGMAVTGHRWMAHKSFYAPRWFQIFGSICGALGGIGAPLVWAAVHRQHHRFVDRIGDPHSPNVDSLWKVQYGIMSIKPNWRHVRDLLKDPFQRALYRFHWRLQFLYVGILALIDPFAIVYAYLVPAFYLWNIGAALNIVCHKLGYRSYDSPDQSRNNFVMAILMWGEGWHNNHHAHPNNWRCGHRWYEIDICSWVIRVIAPRKNN